MKFLSQQDYSTLESVKDECPGAVVIVVEGGWMVFDSATEENQWKQQQ